MKLKWKKIFLYTFLAFGVLLSVSVLAIHMYTNSTLFPSIIAEQEEIKPFEKLILADLKWLEKNPLFKKNEFKKDAGPFLKSYIPLEGLNPKPELSAQNKMVENLFQKFPDWVSNKVSFKGLTSDPDFSKLDPKWLEQLKPFDHWNWLQQSEVKASIDKARTQDSISRVGTMASMPTPKSGLLRNWASVYVIKKLQAKDLQAGLKIYRKIAELLSTSGSLVGQMQAVAMLKAEHKLLNDFQARDWSLVPQNSIEAYKRLSWAWVHMARQPFYFNELQPEFQTYARPDYGVCAAASENMILLYSMRGYLEPQFSFETSYSSNYARASRFQEKILSQCHLDDFNQLMEFSSLAEVPWFTSYNIFSSMTVTKGNPESHWNHAIKNFNWSRVPFIRRVIGLTLLKIATPGTLRAYKDFAEQKAEK